MQDNIDYNALFGVEVEEDGENAQDIAEPAENDADRTEPEEGDNTQDTAEPAPESEEDAEEEADAYSGTDAEENGTKEEAPAKNEQPPEERAKYAAARRKAEQERDAAIARQKADYERQMNELIAGMGLTNPETGNVIKTKVEYDQYKTALAATKRQAFLRRTGIAEDELNAFIEGTPEVVEAKEAMLRIREQEQKTRLDNLRREIERDVEEIGKIDADVKSLENIRAAENWPDIEQRLRRGYSLLDAYKLANMDRLGEKKAAAERQRAINASAQKQHMQRTEQRGSGAVAVPADVKAAYRTFNPGATDAEIAAHYAKYAKR